MHKHKAQKIQNILKSNIFRLKKNKYVETKEILIRLLARYYQDQNLYYLIDIQDNHHYLSGRYLLQVKRTNFYICSSFK